jgi:hypothetical protein
MSSWCVQGRGKSDVVHKLKYSLPRYNQQTLQTRLSNYCVCETWEARRALSGRVNGCFQQDAFPVSFSTFIHIISTHGRHTHTHTHTHTHDKGTQCPRVATNPSLLSFPRHIECPPSLSCLSGHQVSPAHASSPCESRPNTSCLFILKNRSKPSKQDMCQDGLH